MDYVQNAKVKNNKTLLPLIGKLNVTWHSAFLYSVSDHVSFNPM